MIFIFFNLIFFLMTVLTLTLS